MTEAARDRANQWTAFYMITASVMKELNISRHFSLRNIALNATLIALTWIVFIEQSS